MSMVQKLGGKLVKGAKEEIQKEPIHLLDTERLIEWAEVILPIGILALSLIHGLRKSSAETTTIVINNYITGGTAK